MRTSERNSTRNSERTSARTSLHRSSPLLITTLPPSLRSLETRENQGGRVIT